MAEEAPGQPAGGGQARLFALPDPGHTQTHGFLVQKPDAHLRGEDEGCCWGAGGHGVLCAQLPGALSPEAAPGRGWRGAGGDLLLGTSPVQDSRFEVFENGTLRINSVEVYDGTWYRCVSSTPAGGIEAQARVQVLGELAPGRRAGRTREGAAGPGPSGLPPQSLPFPAPETEKLKFTPPPRPQQCMEFDKEATVPCSATGREKPTVKWVRAGGRPVGVGWGWTGGPLGGHGPVSGTAECLVLRDRQER